MNVNDIKENIPTVGEETALNGKLMASASMVTMATPRQPLMDLSQVPRPTTEELKLVGPASKLGSVTPLHSPRLKKTKRKFEPSALVYEDKNEKSLQTSSDQVENSVESKKDIETRYIDHLRQSAEEKEISNFISLVINNSVAGILEEKNETDKNSMKRIEPGSLDIVTCNSDVAEENSDHSYCVNNLKGCAKANVGINDTHTTDHNYCVGKEESLSDDNCVKMDDVDDLYEDDQMGNSRTYENLVEEGACFIDRSNISVCDYFDTQFIEVDISEGLEDELNNETKTDTEFFPSVRQDCQVGIAKETDTDAVTVLTTQVRSDSKDTDHSENSIEETKSTVLNPGFINPQGVTYMSLNADSDTVYSPWKQTLTCTSPDCIKSEGETSSISNSFSSPSSETFKIVSPTHNENLEMTLGHDTHEEPSIMNDSAIEVETCISENQNEMEDLSTVTMLTKMKTEQNAPLLQKNKEYHDRSLMTDTISMDDHACSPIPFVVCDASVQSSSDLRSATTSPFVPYETHDMSMNTDTTATTDAEVVTETPATIYVSIIKDQPEVKDISVSTDESFTSDIDNRNETQDVCVNTERIETNSVTSNTDASDTADNSTLTDTATTVNICVNTALETAEVGVDVRPCVETVYTEMEDLPMSSVGTTMTPVKFHNKFGKRLTAEDVRRQHPRALANEIETLKLQNERVEGHVKSMEHERDKLRASLRETKGSLSKLEKQLEDRENEKDEEKNKIWVLTNRCEELEASLREQSQAHLTEVLGLQNKIGQTELETKIIRTEHLEEVRKIKEEYEQTSYRDHFLASQKLVQQLQSELTEYTHLLEDLEQSQQIQAQLEEKMSAGFSKVKLAEEAVLSLHRTLKARELQLSSQRSDLEQRDTALRENEARIVVEREQMQEIVAGCKLKVEELDNQYQKSCDDLAAVSSKLETLQMDLTLNKTELSRCEEEKQHLEERVGELTQRETSSQRELELLQVTLKQKDEQEKMTSSRLAELESRLQEETNIHKKALEQSRLEICNLQHTLDSREQDIDILEKDLFECREIIYTQMEKIRVTEEKEKSMEIEIKTLAAENQELKGCCAALRGKEQELGDALKYTQEELSGTREHASRMLKEQGKEIGDCSAVVGELTDHMTSVLDSLNRKAGIQIQNMTPKKILHEEQVRPHDPNVALDLTKPPLETDQSQNSLVSMILNAAKSQECKNDTKSGTADTNQDLGESDTKQDSPHASAVQESVLPIVDSKIQNLKQIVDNTDSFTTRSRKKLGFTGNSAFAPVRSGHLIECVKPAVGQNLCANERETQQSDPESSGNTKETDRLSDQVQKMSEMFVEINRLVNLLEKASRSALQDMRRENEELNRRLSQCEFTERRLNANLEYSNKELEQSKAMTSDLEQKLEEMGDRLALYIEQEAEVKRLQQEIGHLHGKQQSLEAEKEFLNDQMKELLERLEQSTEVAQSSGVDVNTQKEILTLQKKVHRLREQLQERQDFIEEVSNKAARRIQKLEDNWKKADAEVLRFDELVDVIRKILVQNEALMRESEIRKIIRLIDGQEPTSTFTKSEKLKPIKTSII